MTISSLRFIVSYLSVQSNVKNSENLLSLHMSSQQVKAVKGLLTTGNTALVWFRAVVEFVPSTVPVVSKTSIELLVRSKVRCTGDVQLV